MTFVDALHDRYKDEVVIVDRIDKKRIVRRINPSYFFYYNDENGVYEAVTGEKLSRVDCHDGREFKKQIQSYKNHKLTTYESDISPLYKTLEQEYADCDTPADMNVAYFDIEADWCKKRGYAEIDDPFNKVTAISIYQRWTGKVFFFVVKPDEMGQEYAEDIVNNFDIYKDLYDEYDEKTIEYLKDKEFSIELVDEKRLFVRMFQELDEADIICGWNSESYDIPYLVNRIELLFGEDANLNWSPLFMPPKPKEVEKFGKLITTYNFIGKNHLDYMQMYKKNTFVPIPSYSLDFIGEKETKERKVKYDGSLDDLYRKEFKRFIAYGIRDTLLIDKIDQKVKLMKQYIVRGFQARVPLTVVNGTVGYIDNSIIMDIHASGQVVFDKRESDESGEIIRAAGAYVAHPKKGLHDHFFMVDLNSLYPSNIRKLNMSPETIVGQLRLDYTNKFLWGRINEGKLWSFKGGDKIIDWTAAWNEVFSVLEYDMVLNKSEEKIWCDYEDGRSVEYTAKELNEMIFTSGSNLILTANGTIIDSSIQGCIPKVLSKWYDERVDIRKLEAEAKADGRWAEFEEYKLQQTIKKLLLNSTYGCLLNEHSRFYRKELGQSVTLTGRKIVQHMSAQANHELTGDYNHIGDSIIYNDTDSAFVTSNNTKNLALCLMPEGNYDLVRFDKLDHFKMCCEKYNVKYQLCDDIWDNELNEVQIKNLQVIIHNLVADKVNDSFPIFCTNSFNSNIKDSNNNEIIVAGKEIDCWRGLFCAKKRYGVLYFEEDDVRMDMIKGDELTDTIQRKGKLKITGLEIKKTDTPVIVQDFMRDLLNGILEGDDETVVKKKIADFKVNFMLLDGWKKGTPKSINNLNELTEIFEETGKCSVGHGKAAINFNILQKINQDFSVHPISAGDRIYVCKLKNNKYGIDTIGIPLEMDNYPEWLKELPYDHTTMMEKTVCKKVENIFGVMDWDIGIYDQIGQTKITSLFANV